MTESTNPPVRMLLVEDDRVDRMAFERCARESGWTYEVTVADSIEAASRALAGHRFDVVVTTASGDEEVAVMAMKSGADDYLIKDPERQYLKVLPVTVASALERKQNREQVRELMTSLAKRGAELEAANRELALFSYTVAHDLRSPLRAITGFAEVLSEDHAASLDGEGRHLLRRIVDNGERMNRLIEGMLALYQTERTTPVLRPVNLSEMARQAVTDATAAGPAREVEVVIQPDLTAVADPDLIKTVFENLIGNALKYSSRKARARVEFGSRIDGGECAYFVRDDGAGFDPRGADRLFRPFQRLHSTQEFPGIGIGLASVERIVRHHGGRIWAEGAVDGGATFWFTLGSA
jgi:light-regulated signal transduction histidine kinase (bacteriophytochrome)